MELLNRLGELESELHQYRTFIREVCAACWTTDAALRLINVIGPPSAESARVNFCQRHISEYFERAWGEESADMTPLLMHQRAADGHSVSFHLEISATRYAVYVDPRRDAAGKVVGTVGAAIDITYRESAKAGV